MTDWPPFGTDELLEALARTYFPGARPALVECEGRRYRALLRGKRAFGGPWEFQTYLEPLEPAVAPNPTHVGFLRSVVVAVTRADEPGPPGTTAAPFVSWKEFATWEEFLAASNPPPGVDGPKAVLRKMRRLERALGPLELNMRDEDPEAFETLIRWKLDHYGPGGGVSILSVPRNLEFYRELHRRGIFAAATLRAGGRLVAGKLGYYAGDRKLWRLTAYDPALKRYSPGSVMELQTLKFSFEAGDAEFDYLHGAEPYKFAYATHIRWLGNAGREPRLERWRRLARWRAAVIMRRYPAFYRGATRAESAARGLRRRIG